MPIGDFTKKKTFHCFKRTLTNLLEYESNETVWQESYYLQTYPRSMFGISRCETLNLDLITKDLKNTHYNRNKQNDAKVSSKYLIEMKLKLFFPNVDHYRIQHDQLQINHH